ncbi:hypothetical protein SpCBS45565_g01213 [Spizellomyces sp. 'palustris']|nr:hypothetical protein SpCBS45565_g01213 [Spizellomyces sp. 'palustris']
MGSFTLPRWIQRALEFLHLKPKQKEKTTKAASKPAPGQKVETPIPERPTPKYNAADFVFSKLVKQDVFKLPGSIPEGMPFNIEDCEVMKKLESFENKVIERVCFIRIDQFRQAKLPLLMNEWSNVYDFNDSTAKNWSLEAPLDAKDYPRLPADVQETVQVNVNHGSIVPLALGRLSGLSGENRTMISFAPEDVTLQILWKLQDHVSIIRIKEQRYSARDVDLLFGHVGDDRVKTVAGQKESCLVIEMECKAVDKIWALIGESMQDTSCVYISRDRETAVKEIELFFGGQ